MTQEQKAKAYDEALERASKLRFQNPFDTVSQMVEYIFPELKESEDERIRKWIIDDIIYNMDNEPLNNSEYKKEAEKAISWLEKLGQQDNYDDNIITHDDEILQAISIGLADAEKDLGWSDFGGLPIEEIQGWLEKQSKSKWSEKDENFFANICSIIDTDRNFTEFAKRRCKEWLKSLKYRYNWKPSEEHIHWLKWVVNKMPDTEKANEAEAVLEDLLEQLKKLKG